MIPRRLVRVVPEHTTEEVEQWWRGACELHRSWHHVTIRDPIDPAGFPLTAPQWGVCESGAQLADLVRAEDLYTRGGCYIDSDLEIFRPFDSLLRLKGFAGWEDEHHICNAVLGFQAGHPALAFYLELALKRLGEGTWASGVGTVTEVFRDRKDILLLPPASFYPLHYRAKAMLELISSEEVRKANPWAFGCHWWAHSWRKND